MKGIYLLCYLLTVASALNAQTIERSALTSFGEAVTISGISYAWTAGECLTQSYVNSPSSLILTQGYLQPEKQDFLFVEEIPANTIGLMVYPNPTVDALYIQSTQSLPVRVRVYDSAGKLIYIQPSFVNITDPLVISVSSWATGTYFIHVESKSLRTPPVSIVKLR
jgi:hypothetical protein